LDAIVSDMRQADVQSASAAHELVAAEERLAKLESQMRVLTATVVTIAQSLANVTQRRDLSDTTPADRAPELDS
jgi:hypothetical protein